MYQPPIKINKGKFLKKNKPDPTSRELAESVGGVAGLVFELKQLQSDVVETVDTKLTEIEKTTTASVKKIDDKVSEFEKTAIGLIKDVQALPHLKGDPGKDADEQKIADYVMSKFPKPLDTSKLTKDILAQVPKLDTKALTKTILEAIPENKASLKIIQEKFEVDPMSVIEKIMALPEGKFKLKTSQVDGLQQTMEAFRSQLGRGYLHGGGDTVAAGTNITITTNSAGQKVISTSGGATGVTSFNTRTGAVTLTSGDVTTALGFTPGTVSSVASADSSITVTNPTSTVDLAVVKSPKLTTARNIAITGDLAWNVNFDGSANVTAAGTLTTVNGNVGTFGSATQVVQVTVNAKGLVTAASNITVTPTVGSITGLGAGVATFLATPSSANLAAAVSDETGSGALVFATSPTLTTAILGSSTATTQTPGDSSTKVATTAYVDNAVLGQNFKEAVKYASTAALPSIVYANGSSGVGATLTGVALAAISLDSSSPSVGDRVLIKNQVSTFQNGIYTVTATGSGIAVFVLTRTVDADQSNEWKTGDSVFVTSGSTLSITTWAYTGGDSPIIGTDPLTFVQTAGQGSFTAGNGITITGVSIAIDTSVTVDKTTVQTLTNKTLTSPTLTTPSLGVATATSINKVAITAPATSATLTIVDGKTLTVNNSIQLTGTDSTVMTFPTTTATIARTDAAQTFTGSQTFAQVIYTNNAITASGNAATVPITSRLNTVTNNSAATLTVTMATAGAVDGQMAVVRILDFSAVAQTITWVNTENSMVIAPVTSNGSTTLPLTVGLMYNAATSKWRCVASA